MNTMTKIKPLLSMNRGKLIAIIPDNLKPALPVKLEIIEINSDGCTVRLTPTEEKGSKGYKSNSGAGHWAYEVIKPDQGTRFGRTFSEIKVMDNGSLEIKTIEPLRTIRAMVKPPARKMKSKVDKAMEAVLKMPPPADPVDPSTIGELVQSINTLKAQLGDAMTLKVGSNGRLVATLEYS